MNNFYAEKIPVGTRVSSRREMYRTQFKNRPIDFGVVIENDGEGFVRVRNEDGREVFGPAVVFSPVPSV